MSRKLFTKILKDGRLRIPVELIDKFKLKDGMFVILEPEGNYIKLIPAVVVLK
jgi:bifunctional DNA-binding transcriptional regulator/antitoxin component of YhaV-PrlF toxin-antitoxin module